MLIRPLFAIAVSTFLIAPAVAQDHKMPMHHPSADKMAHKPIMVEQPWARASIGKNGAAYVTVINHGKSADNLIGVEASVAKRVQLHTHKNDGEIMRMRHIKSIPVPAEGSVTLKPGGHHIMMMGLIHKLKKGEEFPLTLVFEKAGKVTVKVKIKHAGALGGSSDHQKGHGEHKMKH
jgi:periplasmic copper chaperone A